MNKENMNKEENKKMSKKKLMVFGVLGLFAVCLVSAALMSYYGVWTGTFTTTQAVLTTGDPTFSFDDKTYGAGESFSDCDNSVKNNAGVPVAIQFGTTCSSGLLGSDDGTRSESLIDWSSFDGIACDGITTEIYGVLELTNKNVVFGSSPWDIIGTKTATVKYTIVGDEFEAQVIDSTGITLSEYTLIYYKDNSDRFDNPAKAILITNVNKDLPYVEDGNVDEYNYCGTVDNIAKGWTGDNYEHCHGAKIWLVPTADIDMTNGVLTWSNAGNYLFETDLIVYSDDASNEITLLANGGGFDFCVQNDLVTNLEVDTYTIETKILPVTA